MQNADQSPQAAEITLFRFSCLLRAHVIRAFFAVAAVTIALVGNVPFATADPASREPQQSARFTYIGNLEGSISWRATPFCGDGTKLVTVIGMDWPNCVMRVWDAKTCKPLTEPMRQKGVIWRQLTSDGKTLFTATGDNQVTSWDVPTSTLRSVTGVGHELLNAWFSPDGTRFLTKSWNLSKLQLWRAGEAHPFADLYHPDSVTFAAFDRGGARVVTREWATGTPFHLWDAKTGLESCEPIESDFDLQADVSQAAAFDASGKRLVIVRKAGFAMVEAATGKLLNTGHIEGDFETESIRFSGDGSTIALLTRSTDKHDSGSVQIFDSLAGKPFRSVAPSTYACEISPDGKWLFCGNAPSRSTDLWDLSTGSRVQTFKGFASVASISPDGRTIVFNGKTETSVWRVQEK